MEDGVKKIGHEVEDGVRKVASDAESSLKSIESEIEKRGQVLLHEVEDKIDAYLDALAKALTSAALRKVRDMCHTTHTEMSRLEEKRPVLADKINVVSFTMKLGPVTMVFSNFYQRVGDLTTALDRLISEPPAFRRGPVIGLIEALGPTSVDLGISVELAFVIGSNELGIGGELSEIELELATEIADIVLEKLGVPE